MAEAIFEASVRGAGEVARVWGAADVSGDSEWTRDSRSAPAVVARPLTFNAWLSADEVASRLDCSKATVRSHIANARTKLKKFAEKRKR